MQLEAVDLALLGLYEGSRSQGAFSAGVHLLREHGKS